MARIATGARILEQLNQPLNNDKHWYTAHNLYVPSGVNLVFVSDVLPANSRIVDLHIMMNSADASVQMIGSATVTLVDSGSPTLNEVLAGEPIINFGNDSSTGTCDVFGVSFFERWICNKLVTGANRRIAVVFATGSTTPVMGRVSVAYVIT